MRPALLLLSSLGLLACGNEVLVFQGGGGASEGGAPATTATTGGTTSTGGAPTTTSTGGSGGTGAGGSPSTTTTTTTGPGGAGGCEPELITNEPVVSPVDVVLVTDNGFDMAGTIEALEININGSLVALLEAFAIDYRVIVIGAHGPGTLCVPPPLSGTANCNGPPVQVTDQFYHYATPINGGAPLCTMLATAYGGLPDQFSLYPGGWVPLLRPQAEHALVVFSKSGVSCVEGMTQYFDFNQVMQGQDVAVNWDSTLLALAPGIFGTPADRRYTMHSLLNIAEPSGDPSGSYDPDEPVVTQPCPNAFGQVGTGYQWLSKGTRGERMSICGSGMISAQLSNLATAMVDDATDSCRRVLDVPDDFGFEQVVVQYTPQAGPVQEWTQVPVAAACSGPDEFFIDVATKTLELCPDACALLESPVGGAAEPFTSCLMSP